MKRLTLALMSLFFAGSALAACPAHPGQILNGMSVQPAGLHVVCGEPYDTFKNSFKDSPNVKWTELYSINSSAVVKELPQKMTAILSILGYSPAKSKTISPAKRTFGYLNVKTKKIVVMYMTVSGSLVVVSLAGN